MNNDFPLILGNSNKRFSGVTSTMLQVLAHQQTLTSVAVLGRHHLPEHVTSIGFFQLVSVCRRPRANGRYRVFHARRNDEMIQALIAKKLFGAKLKIAFTSTAQRRHSRFTRFLVRQMDAVISTSQVAASYVSDRPVDTIIPHGVDTKRYVPAADKRAAWRATGLPGDYGIGVFGRIRESKGIDVLIDAALPLLEKYSGATVVLCGRCTEQDLAYKNRLLEKIDSAGMRNRVVLLGERPFAEIPTLFRAMTVVAALSRNEGFGLTPLEAMASGCAVLTSEAGVWKEIVRNGIDGYCVATGNVEAAREKLDILLSDLPATEAMGQNGRSQVLSNYTVEREAQRLTDYLLSLG